MKSDFCIIHIECCICLDYLDQDIYNLKCCSNQIHNKCVYDMFVHEHIKENKVIFTCPFCRNQQNFNRVVSLKDIKKYTTDFEILSKYNLHKDSKIKELCKCIKLCLKENILLFILIILIGCVICFLKLTP